MCILAAHIDAADRVGRVLALGHQPGGGAGGAGVRQREHRGAAGLRRDEGVGMDRDEQVGLHPPGLMRTRSAAARNSRCRGSASHACPAGVDASCSRQAIDSTTSSRSRRPMAPGLPAMARIDRDDDQPVDAAATRRHGWRLPPTPGGEAATRRLGRGGRRRTVAPSCGATGRSTRPMNSPSASSMSEAARREASGAVGRCSRCRSCHWR